MESLIDLKLKFYPDRVSKFAAEDNSILPIDGQKISYAQLVVTPGIKVDFSSIKGLPEALANLESHVSSIYGYDTCDKTSEAFPALGRERHSLPSLLEL
jgi:hypothetical protein